jgi:hypothetical protein
LWIVPWFAALAYQGADEQAVRKAIATFNDLQARPTVLTPDADLTPLARYGGPGVSQVYFEPRSVRIVTPEVVFVDARATQFGSTILKRSMPAYFVLRKTGGEWRVAVMRVSP